MNKYKPPLTWSVIVGLLLLVAVAAYNIEHPVSANALTDKATALSRPDFSLLDLEGEVRHINEWDGQYIVLNFWATWCPPCRKEIPEFIALQKKYGSAGLQFIGVAIDDTEAVSQFAMEMGFNYPNLIAESEGIALANQYGNTYGALPFSVIINREGQIIGRQVGLLSTQKILQLTQLQDD
ncbi:MAG: TlpA family protein disulfide reductase [Cycloclasticus sp.]|nr:TlpA family protein disulfide reductase [Cycloclasticus sp.]MBQ0789932.1 TlpA family protein disulfide reductase [Cycloclasticus sp.]